MRGPRESATCQFLRVRAPRARPPDVPHAPSKHPIYAIQSPRLVDEDRPADARLLDVGAGRRGSFEAHNYDSDVEIGEGPLMLLQLQQMPAARQSTQVAVKDQQQPVPVVVLETMDPALTVGKSKGLGGTADHACEHLDAERRTFCRPGIERPDMNSSSDRRGHGADSAAAAVALQRRASWARDGTPYRMALPSMTIAWVAMSPYPAAASRSSPTLRSTTTTSTFAWANARTRVRAFGQLGQ